MTNLLVQGGWFDTGLVPFSVTLTTGFLLARTRWSGACVSVGFVAAVYALADLTFSPFTASRKIILLGLAALICGALLDLVRAAPNKFAVPLAGLAGLATLWVLWLVLRQQDLGAALGIAFVVALHSAWITYWMDRLHRAPLRAAWAGVALASGTGISSLFAASLLLGQFALALAAACAACLVLQWGGLPRVAAGRTFTTPVAMLSASLGAAAFALATLPWPAVVLLAAIPPVAATPLPQRCSHHRQALLVALFTLALAGASIAVTWRVCGPLPE